MWARCLIFMGKIRRSVNYFLNRKNIFWISFVVCAIVSLVPIWVNKYLPMTDLPQHAAQISIITNLDNPIFGFYERFSINWFTPYVMAYAVGALFSNFFGVLIATKLILSINVLGLAGALVLLIRKLGGDRWLSLFGFILPYGFSFYWGFVAFSFSISIGIIYLLAGKSYFQFPTLRKGVLFSLVGFTLFFSHAITYGVMSVGVFLMVFIFQPKRKFFIRLFPLIVQVPLVIYWMNENKAGGVSLDEQIVWSAGFIRRVTEIPSLLFSNTDDSMSVKFFLVMLSGIFLGVDYRKLNKVGLIVFVSSAILYFAMPYYVFRISWVYQRLAIFLFIGFLLSWVPIKPGIRRNFSHLVIFLGVVFWGMISAGRCGNFNREAVCFDRVIEHVPYNKKVLPLIVDKGSAYGTHLAYVHFAAWYQAGKGGDIGYSFASLYNMVARYQAGMSAMSYERSWIVGDPYAFNWALDGVHFDYFLVKSSNKVASKIFKEGMNFVKIIFKCEDWELYARNLEEVKI
ncbi:MAG: hypothetical protein KCHDKBKB_02682 [Elusimicrobia bacterium]|nr:hypothetical protein [Elusimicrobiota bacterium]